jgi:hypothetical protein
MSELLKEDIDAAAMLHRAITSWYVILLAGLVGAVLGWLISFARPPLYQASVFIEYAVDYSRTAHMDDITVHQAYEQVRRMLLADETLQATLNAANEMVDEELIFSATADLRSQIQLSRYPGGFELIVYGQDPEQSAAAVNAWADVALGETEKAIGHAIRAAELQSKIYKAGCKLSPDPGDSDRVVWLCASGRPNIDSEELADDLLREVQQTRGILPIFTFSLLQDAQVPTDAIAWSRGSFILAGAMIGLLLGFIGVNLYKSEK